MHDDGAGRWRGDPDTGSAAARLRELHAGRARRGTCRGRSRDLGASADAGDVRARRSTTPTTELYRAYLAQSDIFIGLYWQRYGWIGPGMDISGLEDELRLSHALPRLLYVKAPAPDREPRLTAMIERPAVRGDRLLPVVRESARARPVGPRRPGDAAQRAVRDDGARCRSLGVVCIEQRESSPAVPTGVVDVVDRPPARHRRGRDTPRVSGGAVGHPHRPGRRRQDAAGDRRR